MKTFTVNTTIGVGANRPVLEAGMVVTEDDFGEGADLDHLIRSRAITPAGETPEAATSLAESETVNALRAELRISQQAHAETLEKLELAVATLSLLSQEEREELDRRAAAKADEEKAAAEQAAAAEKAQQKKNVPINKANK